MVSQIQQNLILLKKKIKQTCLERYGEECNFAGKIFREKVQQKMIHKYGVDNPLKNDIIKQKVKQTQIDKYGGVGLQSLYIKRKAQSTCMNYYGVSNPGSISEIKEKVVKTNIVRYGVPCGFMTEKCIKNAHSNEAKHKSYQTKKRNGTFSTSQTENQTFNI